jgi:hypothetical protein
MTTAGTILFAGTFDGLFRSTDGGLTWAAETTLLSDHTVRSVTSSGTAVFAGTQFAGVWRGPL